MSKSPTIPGILVVALFLVGGAAQAKVVQYAGVFVESEVIPPTSSSATSSGIFIIDTEANTLSAVITMEGIIDDALPIVHGPGLSGDEAPALFAFPPGNPVVTGTWDYDESFEADILAGLMYIDVHTEAFPDGELRGQIVEDCGAGTVNLGTGSPEDVLRVNGSAGQPGCREVSVAIGAPITIACDASSAGPAVGPYVIWAWIGGPANPRELSAQGSRIGCLANPTPFEAENPQPFRCLRGGLPPIVCNGVPEVPSPPSVPFQVLRSGGVGSALTVTLQGIIKDAGSAHPQDFSTTNMVVLVVE